MAVQKLQIVAGNSAPPWLLTAKRAGVPIDVTGCTVTLILAKGSTITNVGHQPCTLVTPVSGLVQYTPTVTDCPTPGTYKADLKVVYANGGIEILYDQLQIKARKHL
jgi:hypothetical protein